MSPTAVGIGHARVDHLAVVDRYPEPEARLDVAGLSIQGGGTVATALAALATFNVNCSFVGVLSDDDFGTHALRSLSGLGVDVSFVEVQRGRMSPYAFIILERESGRRTILSTAGNVEPLVPKSFDPAWLEGARVLLVDGSQVAVQVRAAREARRRGIPVLLGLGFVSRGLEELLSLTDVLVTSERRASAVAPRGEVEDCLLELATMGPRVVVITLGREGSIGVEGNKLVRQPPVEVNVVDTTGAGDIFFGGYAYGTIEGWPLERCMQCASVAASLSCRELGSRAGLPELEQVEATCWQESHT